MQFNHRKRSPLSTHKHEIENLNLILSRVFREYALDLEHREESKTQSALLEHWTKCVGEEIAAETEPMGIRHHCLTIKVFSPVWYHHLSHVMKTTILAQLQKHFPQLKQIRFTLSARKKSPAAGKKKLPRHG